MNEDTLQRVVILDSESHNKYEFWAVARRLSAFKEMMLINPILGELEDWGEGIDSAAVMGMTILFETIPPKFPVKDILIWLRDYIDPNLPLVAVETGLVLFARENVQHI
jgi:hypothetical protein